MSIASPKMAATRMLALLLALAMVAGLSATLAPPAAADVTTGLILRYDLNQTSGSTVTDASGNGRDGSLVGGASWAGGDGVALDGTNGYVKVPNNVMSGLTQITVSTDVFIETTQATPYMIWAFGNTSSNAGNGYLMTTGNNYRSSIASGNYTTEQTATSNAALTRGTWKTITYTLDGSGTAIIYTDGVEAGRRTGGTITPGSIGGGTTTANYIGRSVYTADKYLKGKVRGFRVYNRALTAAEVASLAPTPTDKVSRDKAALSLGDTSAVTSNLTLPTGGANGSTIAWTSSNPTVVSATGVVTRQPADTTVQLTATISNGTASDTKTFDVAVRSNGQQAAEAAAALSVTNLSDVRGNLTLPGSGLFGSTVTWASSDPATIASTGEVHRPAFGQPANQVVLTATVTAGSSTATRSFTATVPALPEAKPYTGYAFSYFTGNSIAGEKIYFAASQGNNALQWTEVNGGQPKLTSTLGTTGLRDPFLIRSPEGDKFYLIATDLSIGGGTSWDDSQRAGSKYIEVWESTDLVNWSAQRHVKVSPDTAGNTWAPEAFYSQELGSYVVFWASKLYATNDPNHTGTTYNKMLYATTRDFVTFSEPKIWQDPGTSVIDSTVIKEGSTYYRFTKDEGAVSGCSDILMEKSPSLTAVDDISVPGYDPNNRNWKPVANCIGRTAGTSAVEGPTSFKANPGDTSGNQYYLFVDEFGGRGYIPLGTNDLNNPNWKVPASFRLPSSPRHGTVIPVTQDELKALINAPDPLSANADGLIAQYKLDQTSGTTVVDSSGNGHNATLSGDASWADGSLSLGGTTGHVKLPDNMMAGLDQITVSTRVWIDSSQATPYFIWGMGNTVNNAGSGYLFTTGNNYRTSLATGTYTTEQTATNNTALGRGSWQTLTYTLGGDHVATIYLNGIKVGEKAGVTAVPGDIGNGRTTANYIGRSLYTADKYLKGKVADFRVYNRALSASEVLGLPGNAAGIGAVTLDSLKIPATITPATNRILLPLKPGTDLTTLEPVFTIAPGATLSEAGPQNYSTPHTITVTAADGATSTWTVEAHIMRSPSLPGLYADPNIVQFNGTYYIYATTDGVAGWGGKDFYVWKSTNLADWTRSEQPFLTLDGANGNVPWATGNAWAPTITDRDGKYYFYFSGHNPTYNRKTIGVAVADSPEGPFTAQPTAMILNNEPITSGQAIDPAAFKDPATGKYYLFWGNGSPVYAELNDDMLSIKTDTIKKITGLTDFREGSFVNYRNGTYYLTYSIDDTGSTNYRVGYATSSSIDGPWTYRGVILQKNTDLGILATGHSSIVQVPGTDDWYIAYHRFGMPGGDGTHRETTIDRLYFNPDGTIKPVVPTLESVDPIAAVATPTATVAPAGSDGWYGNGATLSLTGAAGTAELHYKIGAGDWTRWTAPVPLAAGSYDIQFRAKGTNLTTSQVGTLAVKVDLTAPTATAALAQRTVTVSTFDEAEGSGVSAVEYRLDAGAWTPYTAPVVVDSQAHTVRYRATDTAGNTSAEGTLAVPAVSTGTAPGSPAVVTVGTGDKAAKVTWTAPANTGGSPITKYTVTAAPGGKTCTTAGTLFCTITGLTNGKSYTFTVTATNATGTSAPSAPSTPITLSFPPGGTDTSVSVNAKAQCINGKPQLAVYALNKEAVKVDVRVTTALGEQKITGLAAGTAKYLTFDSTATSLTGGTTTISAYKFVNGQGYYTTYEAGYLPVSCG